VTSSTNTEEKTDVIYGSENIIKRVLQAILQIKERLDLFEDIASQFIITSNDLLMDSYIKAKDKGIKIRIIAEITSDSLPYLKKMMSFAEEIRHIDGIIGAFGVSERDYLSADTSPLGTVPQQAIYSTSKVFVQQQQYFFDTLWKNAIPAEQKIQEIEKGIKSAKIETIADPYEIQTKYIHLLEKATSEILLIFPSSNSMQRQHHLGVFQILKEKVNQCDNIKIRIIFPSLPLLPLSFSNESLKEEINPEFELLNFNIYKKNIFIRNIDISLSTKSTRLVVDREESLVMEVKNDLKDKFSESVGFGTYSNSSATVISYVSIFESLWVQTELYQQLKDANEKLKVQDMMQKDFINIAVHELRNPIQPIIGLTEFLKNKTTDKKQHEIFDIIDRNAKRLFKLSEDVLDISKIESHSLSLNKENFNLNEMIQNIILVYTQKQINKNKLQQQQQQQQQQLHKVTLKIESLLKDDIIIYADKSRLNQVISNLLDNAIKFTKEKEKEETDGNIITIIVEKNCSSNDVIVSIRDTGKGIDSEILPRLFTKFVTKSGSGGTGLGLYISKSIIEAHGGIIWAKNNEEGKGATFGFSLPDIN